MNWVSALAPVGQEERILFVVLYEVNGPRVRGQLSGCLERRRRVQGHPIRHLRYRLHTANARNRDRKRASQLPFSG